MTRRRALTAWLASWCAGAMLPARAAFAQTAAGRPKRIAVLSPGADPRRPAFDSFRDALAKLGLSEGRDFVIEFHLAGADTAQSLASLVDKAVRPGTDMILAEGREANELAWAATRTIPIVVISSLDLVARGMAQSLARPGGNVTGVSLLLAETAQKQTELLIESVPGIRSLIVLHATPASPVHRAAQEAAARLGVAAHLAQATATAEIERVIDAAAREKTGGVVVLADPLLASLRLAIVEALNAAHLPAAFMEREYADAGGLMSYGVDITALYRQVAIYADRILRGVKAGDLPIERTTKVEFVINMRTARAQDFRIPPSVLVRADEVIE